MLSTQERTLRLLMRLYTLGTAATVLFGCILSLFGDRLGISSNVLPLTLTATVGTALFALVALFAASDERYLKLLALLIAIGHAFGAIMTTAALLLTNTDGQIVCGSLTFSVRQILYGFLLVDITVSSVLFWQLKAIERSHLAERD